jgi:hypothetical protein
MTGDGAEVGVGPGRRSREGEHPAVHAGEGCRVGAGHLLASLGRLEDLEAPTLMGVWDQQILVEKLLK